MTVSETTVINTDTRHGFTSEEVQTALEAALAAAELVNEDGGGRRSATGGVNGTMRTVGVESSGGGSHDRESESEEDEGYYRQIMVTIR